MPFKGCLSDACVLMKIERFVLKQHTFRFADYICGSHQESINPEQTSWHG